MAAGDAYRFGAARRSERSISRSTRWAASPVRPMAIQPWIAGVAPAAPLLEPYHVCHVTVDGRPDH